jgi:putative aldouronate transport system permease protein
MVAAARIAGKSDTTFAPKKGWALVKKRIWTSRYLYLLFLFPLLYFIIFKYGAMVWLTIAFKDYNAVQGLWKSEWIGFKHFVTFFQTPDILRLIRNTVLLSVYSLLWSFPMPIFLALMINEVQNKPFKKVVQNISYLPHFFSTVIICGILVNILSTNGLVNQFLGLFQIDPVNFLTKPQYFRTIYIASGIWQSVGWGSIIYLAALSGVDPGLYESAVIDGAGKLQQMRYISIPSILPIIVIQFLLSLGRIMSVGYEKVLLLYNGSIYETADVISTYVYRRGLESSEFSYATAVSMFESVINIILVWTVNKIAQHLGETSLW